MKTNESEYDVIVCVGESDCVYAHMIMKSSRWQQDIFLNVMSGLKNKTQTLG